jgi:hypothetical protein
MQLPKKQPPKNTHSIGENSPNLVTLAIMRRPVFSPLQIAYYLLQNGRKGLSHICNEGYFQCYNSLGRRRQQHLDWWARVARFFLVEHTKIEKSVPDEHKI